MKTTDKEEHKTITGTDESATRTDGCSNGGKYGAGSGTDESTDAASSLRTFIRKGANEEEQPGTKDLSLKDLIWGEFLVSKFIREQMMLLVIICAFIVVYISNRFQCQQNTIKISRLTEQLKDAKYRALASSSELTEMTRKSRVLLKLRENNDSTLQMSKQPPYIINTDDAQQ